MQANSLLSELLLLLDIMFYYLGENGDINALLPNHTVSLGIKLLPTARIVE